MSIKITKLRNGYDGYKVVDSKGKTLCTSPNRLDCEQYIFAMRMLKKYFPQ